MLEQWDVVISDISMPGHSGLETLQEVRRTRPGTVDPGDHPGPGRIIIKMNLKNNADLALYAIFGHVTVFFLGQKIKNRPR